MSSTSRMHLTEAAQKKRRRAYSKHVMMRVSQIRFTQTSVNNRFGNSLPIDWTIEKLRDGTILPRELPLIRVGKLRGKYRSVDNRRLYCYKTAGIEMVPVVLIERDRKFKQVLEKNKSKNNGTGVDIVEVPLNEKNLECSVITYDPMKERPSQFWTVGQAICELATCGPAEVDVIAEKVTPGEIPDVSNLDIDQSDIEEKELRP